VATHVIQHGLGHELARRATRRALESYRQSLSEYAPKGEWITDDRALVEFTVVGRTLSGSVDVHPTEIVLVLDVPLVFRVFQGIALRVVEAEIEQWIARARAGELDDEE
jgi:hypothetical protein